MSTPKSDQIEANARRMYLDINARQLGHAMIWQLGLNATHQGHAYHWVGRCGDCGAEVSVGARWSTCAGVRDARKVRCSGPGTAVLTEIEAARSGDLITAAVAEFGRSLAP
ncbi:MAG: hypothetical protein ACT4NY_22705 [Pseudonocardiales bacterium]